MFSHTLSQLQISSWETTNSFARVAVNRSRCQRVPAQTGVILEERKDLEHDKEEEFSEQEAFFAFLGQDNADFRRECGE